MAVQKDSVYGFVSKAFPIFEDGFEQSGTIYVCEGGLVVKYRNKLIRAPPDYVKKMEKVSDLPLGKVSVIFKIYDQLGQEHDMAVGISDLHYETLRRMCPNAEPKNIKNVD